MILWAARSIEVENLAALSVKLEQGKPLRVYLVGLVKRWLPDIVAALLLFRTLGFHEAHNTIDKQPGRTQVKGQQRVSKAALGTRKALNCLVE
jgi:hypothetical protein